MDQFAEPLVTWFKKLWSLVWRPRLLSPTTMVNESAPDAGGGAPPLSPRALPPPIAPAVLPALPPPPQPFVPLAHPPRKPRAPPPAASTSGAFTHLEDILNDLPECRRSVLKMRKFDKEAYDYHSRLGARVIGSNARITRQTLLPAFAETLPSAGMVFSPHRADTEESIFPTFVYFVKVKERANYYDVPGDVIAFYRVTVMFVDVTKKMGTGKSVSAGLSVMMAVRKDGRPWALKEIQSETFRTKHAGHYKTKPIGNGRWSRHKVHLPRGKSWRRSYIGYPPTLEAWGRDPVLVRHNGRALAPHELAVRLFSYAANCFTVSANDDFQVRAERDGVSVAFSVALGRTPYFFKDRQTTVATDGRRKRIFHAVVEHQRVYPNGKVATVRPHYRGERVFDWHDEKITITAPANSLITWNVAAHEVDDAEVLPYPEHMTSSQTADFLKHTLEERKQLIH